MNLIKLDYSINEIDGILKTMALITIDNTSYIYGEDMNSEEISKCILNTKKRQCL